MQAEFTLFPSFTHETKRCPRCGVTKSLDEFHRSKTRKDGHTWRCKVCTAADIAASRIPQPDAPSDPAWQEVACAACGKLIRRRVTGLKDKATDRVFCSKECLYATGTKPRKGTERACEMCGTVFYVAQYNDKRFCSVPCYDEWQRRNRETRICEVCGSDFVLKPSQAKDNAGRFCSLACMHIASRKHAMDRMHNGKPVFHTSHGYVKVWEPEHPKATGGYVLEHRIVMERILGRYLRSDEHVHHISGVKDENDPANLTLMDAEEHRALSLSDWKEQDRAEHEADARELAEYRKRYGPLDVS